MRSWFLVSGLFKRWEFSWFGRRIENTTWVVAWRGGTWSRLAEILVHQHLRFKDLETSRCGALLNWYGMSGPYLRFMVCQSREWKVKTRLHQDVCLLIFCGVQPSQTPSKPREHSISRRPNSERNKAIIFSKPRRSKPYVGASWNFWKRTAQPRFRPERNGRRPESSSLAQTAFSFCYLFIYIQIPAEEASDAKTAAACAACLEVPLKVGPEGLKKNPPRIDVKKIQASWLGLEAFPMFHPPPWWVFMRFSLLKEIFWNWGMSLIWRPECHLLDPAKLFKPKAAWMSMGQRLAWFFCLRRQTGWAWFFCFFPFGRRIRSAPRVNTRVENPKRPCLAEHSSGSGRVFSLTQSNTTHQSPKLIELHLAGFLLDSSLSFAFLPCLCLSFRGLVWPCRRLFWNSEKSCPRRPFLWLVRWSPMETLVSLARWAWRWACLNVRVAVLVSVTAWFSHRWKPIGSSFWGGKPPNEVYFGLLRWNVYPWAQW